MGQSVEINQKSFREIYNSLPSRQTVKAPKVAFVEHVAEVTMKSKKTVYGWLCGVQKPDPLTLSVLSKELNVPGEVLFPQKESRNETC
jgi:transcriptional regulator with XRE-family HTH domain